MAVIFQWIEGMADAGANQYTFHIEATEDPMQCIRKIREAGMKVCLINSTPGGCLLLGRCLLPGGLSVPRGVSAPRGGVSAPRGCIPACTEADTLPPPWTEFLTHACENIAVAQLRCGR